MAPLVIGMVLGPHLELTLRQGLILSHNNMLVFYGQHPLGVVLTLVALLVLSLPLIRWLIARPSS